MFKETLVVLKDNHVLKIHKSQNTTKLPEDAILGLVTSWWRFLATAVPAFRHVRTSGEGPGFVPGRHKGTPVLPVGQIITWPA